MVIKTHVELKNNLTIHPHFFFIKGKNTSRRYRPIWYIFTSFVTRFCLDYKIITFGGDVNSAKPYMVGSKPYRNRYGTSSSLHASFGTNKALKILFDQIIQCLE